MASWMVVQGNVAYATVEHAEYVGQVGSDYVFELDSGEQRRVGVRSGSEVKEKYPTITATDDDAW